MTNFAWWADETYRKSHKFMCCLCFEDFSLQELHSDADGVYEDVCIPCWDAEEREMVKRGLK